MLINNDKKYITKKQSFFEHILNDKFKNYFFYFRSANFCSKHKYGPTFNFRLSLL